MIISLLLVAQMNTRLGFPGIHYGLWASIGVLAVYGLVVIGCAAIATAPSNSEEGKRSEIVFGVSVLMIAALLLQALPHVESGIQFIPLLPWIYTSWLARIFSAFLWFFIVYGCLLTCSSEKRDWEGAGQWMILALGLNAVLSFATPATTVAENNPVLSDPIAQWERLRDSQRDALEKLMADKEELLNRIRNLGATNKKELMANPVGRMLVEELEQLCQLINTAKNEVNVVETAIERAKSHRRSIERRTMLSGITNKEYEQMSNLHHTLAEERRQPPGSEIQRDKLLNELFSGRE
jgi:hypothetical protein